LRVQGWHVKMVNFYVSEHKVLLAHVGGLVPAPDPPCSSITSTPSVIGVVKGSARSASSRRVLTVSGSQVDSETNH